MSNCFEDPSETAEYEESSVNLCDVLKQLEELGDRFSKPPEEFDPVVLVQSIINKNFNDEITQRMNGTLESLLSKLDKLKCFLSIY